MKKESSFKGTIVFMQPDYYKADLNGKVWFHKKNKKEYLGHTGKYDEISDFLVRPGYHTIPYDHTNNREPISIDKLINISCTKNYDICFISLIQNDSHSL